MGPLSEIAAWLRHRPVPDIAGWLRRRPARWLSSLTVAARLGLANSLLIVLICATLSWVLAQRYLDNVSSQLTERGRTISAHLAREAGRSMMRDLYDLEQQARAQGGLAYVRFFDTHGLLLAAGGRAPVGAAVPTPEVESDAQGPVAVGSAVWEFRAPIYAPNRHPAHPETIGSVAVGVSLEALTALRRRTLGTAAFCTSLFALVAVLGAVRIARAITSPLGELAAAADAVARGDFGVHVAVTTRDEIGRLGRSFNAMVDSLGASAMLEEKVRELQEVTRLKSEFLAAVSHELRTPLNVIIGYTEMLTAGAGGPVSEEQAEMLAAVRRYSKLQLEMITNVLDYSRLVSGKMSFHVERFALAPMLEEILAMHRARLGDRAVRLTATVDPGLEELETDRIKLHEIVRNLVDNAVKFTEAGLIAVTGGPGTTRKSVLIEVTDSGPGIRPEDLQTIFDAFQQVGQRTTHAGGVGLGLSIVKQLVDALGGTVSVTSRLGEGSAFRVEIPRVLPGDGAAAATTSAPADAVVRSVPKTQEPMGTLRLFRRRGDRALASGTR